MTLVFRRRSASEQAKAQTGPVLGPDDFDKLVDQVQTYHEQCHGDDQPFHMHLPAYRYGWNLVVSERYGGQPWAHVEPYARRRWEENNPGTWDKYAPSIRYGWTEGALRLHSFGSGSLRRAALQRR
jgi:hypothetical protein